MSNNNSSTYAFDGQVCYRVNADELEKCNNRKTRNEKLLPERIKGRVFYSTIGIYLLYALRH